MERMTMKIALDNLCTNYGQYKTRKEYKEMLQSGVDRGLTVKAAYIGIKMVLAEHSGESEYFTVDDVMEVTGEDRETILERIEQLRNEYEAQGGNPDDLCTPINHYRYMVKL